MHLFEPHPPLNLGHSDALAEDFDGTSRWLQLSDKSEFREEHVPSIPGGEADSRIVAQRVGFSDVQQVLNCKDK